MKFSILSIVCAIPAIVSAGWLTIHQMPSDLTWLRVDQFDPSEWWVSCAGGKRLYKKDLVYEIGEGLLYEKRSPYLVFATHDVSHVQKTKTVKGSKLFVIVLEFIIPIPENHQQSVPIYLHGASYFDLFSKEEKFTQCDHGLL